MNLRLAIGIITAALTLSQVAARAQLGVLHLIDGTVMRGDLTETETEIVLRNALGETRIARDRVERIAWIEIEGPPTSQPASQPPNRSGFQN